MIRAILDFAYDLAQAVAMVVFVAGMMLAIVGVTPCLQEDSRNCLWDAQAQGNGRGQSFIDVAGGTIRF